MLRHRGFFYGYISRRRRVDNQHYLLQSATNCYILQVRSESEEKMEEYILFSKCCCCDSKITETATINEDGERICVDCYEVCYAESEDY